jgi:hypothetical protein
VSVELFIFTLRSHVKERWCYPRLWMDVYGLSPAVLPSVKKRRYALSKRRGGPQSRSGRLVMRKSPSPAGNRTTVTVFRCLIWSLPIALSRLLHCAGLPLFNSAESIPRYILSDEVEATGLFHGVLPLKS